MSVTLPERVKLVNNANSAQTTAEGSADEVIRDDNQISSGKALIRPIHTETHFVYLMLGACLAVLFLAAARSKRSIVH